MDTFSTGNLKSYICSHVFQDERPILLIVHEDGDWVFMCGKSDHGDNDIHIVGVGHLVDRDPSINECANLANDCEAERETVASPWIRTRINAKAS
jgi:hypothetical protein